MPKSPKVRKQSSKREREEGRTSEEGTNPFRKNTRTGRFRSRSKEGNKSKEMDKEMKTMIREIREDTAGIREENKVLRKELAAVREEKEELRKELAAVKEEMRGREEKWQAEEADWIKRIKVIEEKMKQTEKKERKNKVVITRIGGIRGNKERGWKNG
jgi:flagellar motility protein MotE (MotC chaperone)